MNEKVKVEILDHDDPRSCGGSRPEFSQEPFGNDFHSSGTFRKFYSAGSFSGRRPSSTFFFLPGCAGMLCFALLFVLAGAVILILLPILILFWILFSFFRFWGLSSRSGVSGNFQNTGNSGASGSSGNSGDPPLFIQVFHSESWKR